MKVAIISDIHGNMRALDAALEDIQKQHVDHLVCAGDIPNPFLRSREVWLKLKALGIPIVRGNHEDYIVSYFSGDRVDVRHSVQFLPVQVVAQHLGPEIAREFAALPFDHTVSGPGGDDLYICHASPQHNARSYIAAIDEPMADALARISARTIVAGHIHTQWSGKWRNKNLVIGGSVGLPHHGEPEAEYALMTHQAGEWRWDLRKVRYDAAGAMQEYLESGALESGGPIAWMLYDELWCAEPRLAFFLPKVLSSPSPPKSLKEWEAAAKTYLLGIGRWDELNKKCPTTL